MKNVLVPTDFSSNSKSGVRFAIRWATRQNVEIIFVHVQNILRATSWSDAYYAKYAAAEEKLTRAKFEKFIFGLYREMRVKPGKHSFVVINGTSADLAILDYCRRKKNIDCICISTRGAGKLKKFFGTNTGNLITKSDVPVLAIPKTHRAFNVKSILYATDLKNYTPEIKKVLAFARPLKLKIDVVHFSWPDEILLKEKNIKASYEKQFGYNIKLHFEAKDAVHTLIENLEKQIRLKKPSIVVMFTNQKRTFFEKIFLSSKAEELSFKTTVPLLVFNKNMPGRK